MSSVVTFRVGQVWLGVDVDSVEEIIEEGALTPLPHAPRHVIGLMNLRGMALPMMDLAQFLDLAPLDRAVEYTRTVVVRANGSRVGLRSDQVLGVEEGEGERQEVRFAPAKLAEFARGEIDGTERVVTVLHLERLLSAARVSN